MRDQSRSKRAVVDLHISQLWQLLLLLLASSLHPSHFVAPQTSNGRQRQHVFYIICALHFLAFLLFFFFDEFHPSFLNYFLPFRLFCSLVFSVSFRSWVSRVYLHADLTDVGHG